MMRNYLEILLLMTWRRKTALMISIIILSLILYGLQFSKLRQLEFLERLRKTPVEIQAGSVIMDKPHHSQLTVIREQTAQERDQAIGLSLLLNMDPVYPYIPKSRLVHLDLKGAPPLLTYYKKFFKMIRNMGATGILLEYEDMFPYSGILSKARAKNAYTVEETQEILKQAEDCKLEVVPLIQTFGHLEFALKHQTWADLREVPSSPQSLCPSRNESLAFIEEMIKQVLALHPNIEYLHVGCDEVFQMGECHLCRNQVRDNLFLNHVVKVAKIVKKLRPHLRVLIWDDMLRHVSIQSLYAVALGGLVEPMVWVYAEDVSNFVQPPVWEKYSRVFDTVWTASAFKGAFGETLTVPDARRHLENNLRWLELMGQREKEFRRGFAGVALTGWQRYDHFAVLCELLPAGVPSLALNLLTLTNGYFNVKLKKVFLTNLSCPENNPFINLQTDPYLWTRLRKCLFPGSEFFDLTHRLRVLETDVREFVRNVKESKGWMTDYNLRRGYSLNLRIEELVADLPRLHHDGVNLIRMTFDALTGIYDNFTIYEWVEQKIYPHLLQLETIYNQSKALKMINRWESRPLKPLAELIRLGEPLF